MIEAAPTPPLRKRATSNGSKRPSWNRYKAVNPYACDWCRLNQRDDPLAPVARQARYRRRVAGEPDLLLCGGHASDQRVIDGMPRYRGF